MATEKYYWLKLHRDFFKRHDVKIVESLKNGKDYILFYLKLLCESIDHEGRLRFSDSLPYNEEMLATITDTNIDIVRSAVKIFCELSLMEILEDGTYFMTEVQKMVGSASANPNAIRQQRFRDTHKNQPVLVYDNPSVTKSNASVTHGVTNSNVEKDIDIELEKDISGIEREDNNSCIDREVPTKGVRRPNEHDIAVEFMQRFNAVDGVTKCVKMHYNREVCVSTLMSIFKEDEIFKAFDNLRKSDFLRGKVTGINGKPFNCTFDWFINIANFTKVLEGAYNDTSTSDQTAETKELSPEDYLNQGGSL